MTVEERASLLEGSVSVDPGDPRARRFAVRRTERGIEIFDIKWTRDVDGEPEFHGHPASRVDRLALRIFTERGALTESEGRRLARELPGC